MHECSTEGTKTYTSCASLAALGVKLNEMNLFEPIRRRVQIAQKTVKDQPIDKIYDGWMAMLAGAHGLVMCSRWRRRSMRSIGSIARAASTTSGDSI